MINNITKIIIGLILNKTTDNTHQYPHLNLTATLTHQSFNLNNTHGTNLQDLHRIEVHVRMEDREPASHLGAANIHHQRIAVSKGSRRSFDTVEMVVRPFVIEALFSDPDSLDDAPPFFPLHITNVVL